MSAADKQTAAEALERIENLEKENADLKRRVDNLEKLLQGRLDRPAPPAPQIRRPGVIVAGQPARIATPLPGVPDAAPLPPPKPPEPPKAA